MSEYKRRVARVNGYGVRRLLENRINIEIKILVQPEHGDIDPGYPTDLTDYFDPGIELVIEAMGTSVGYAAMPLVAVNRDYRGQGNRRLHLPDCRGSATFTSRLRRRRSGYQACDQKVTGCWIGTANYIDPNVPPGY